jgi:3-methyladenine DNA glycosylase AlkD
MNFIQALEKELLAHRNADNAIKMEAYMKDNFHYLGIKTEQRRIILKQLWKKHKSEIQSDFRGISWSLFTKKEREFQYCGMEILIQEIKKNYKKEDDLLIEKWLTTHSWWDSVDLLAKYLLGNYLLQFPEKTSEVIERFSNSENRWLNRSALLFQLNYKKNTDFELLKSECEKHKNSKEFFIQKAIGWALRDYGRFNPNAVKNYVENTNLKPLSKKEALRNILK